MTDRIQLAAVVDRLIFGHDTTFDAEDARELDRLLPAEVRAGFFGRFLRVGVKASMSGNTQGYAAGVGNVRIADDKSFEFDSRGRHILRAGQWKLCRCGRDIEIDAGLAEKARAALMPWPQIVVSHADGANLSFEPADLIVASAGATHPLPSWLDALKQGGRLMFPMTATRRGGMLLVTREVEDGFSARFLCQVGFIDFSGARDPDIDRRLAAALARDSGRAVRSLRRHYHARDRTCWLHSEGWCLSRRLPAVSKTATS